MAIRINLLAEAQAAEEQRRKDPVKRGTYAGAFLVCLIALWGVSLQFKVIAAKSRLTQLDAKWQSIEKDYQSAVEIQRSSMNAESKLIALHQMTTNRFLWGNVLNGFQQTLTGISGVQVTRFRVEQSYSILDGTPAKTNKNVVTAGKAGSATEKIGMTIEAMDTSSGNRVNAFKEAIAGIPFFKDSLAKTNGVLLTSRSAPQTNPNTGNGQNSFVMFSLRCSFPEKTR